MRSSFWCAVSSMNFVVFILLKLSKSFSKSENKKCVLDIEAFRTKALGKIFVSQLYNLIQTSNYSQTCEAYFNFTS